MKIQTKISIIFDCKSCGGRYETETDFPWIDETKIFRCEFCGAKMQIKCVPVEEKENGDD